MKIEIDDSKQSAVTAIRPRDSEGRNDIRLANALAKALQRTAVTLCVNGINKFYYFKPDGNNEVSVSFSFNGKLESYASIEAHIDEAQKYFSSRMAELNALEENINTLKAARNGSESSE